MANETVDISEQELADDGVWTTGPDGELIPDYDATFPTINEGEVVHGTVVRVDKDEVLVDIGYKSEGVIPVAELSIRRSVNPADEVSVGEQIDALVMTKEDAEGRLILSKKRARFELAWKKIEAAAESGEPGVGKVIEVVKGGLILDLGVRGFLPASLVDIRRVQDLDEFLGQELRTQVIELNRARNNVVLSRRAVLEDERKEQRKAILDRLQPGDVVNGQISNIVDFGAFVDLDGMDGLIHISELSLKRCAEGQEPRPRADGAESVHLTPHLDLSEDVFKDEPPGEAEAAEAPAAEAEAEEERPTEDELEPAEAVEAPVAEAESDEQPAAEDEPEPAAAP